jgi:hypothetical protein
MDSIRDLKNMAIRLREALAEKNICIGQGEALNLVAKQFGSKNWNVLAAQMKHGASKPAQREMFLGWERTGIDFHLFEDVMDQTLLYEGNPTLRLRRKADDLKQHDRVPMITLMQKHNWVP